MKRRIKRICKTLALTILTSAAATFPLAQANNDDQTIDNHQSYVFGTFFTSNEDITMQCYLSKNGIRMVPFRAVEDIKGRDISCQYYEGYFYICLVEPQTPENPLKENTFKLYRSKDLKEWEVVSFKVTERGDKYREVWAPDLFIDDNGSGSGAASAYVYFAKQKGLISKPYEAQFNLYVYKIENIAKIDKFVKVDSSDEAKEGTIITKTGKIDKTIEPMKTIEGKATTVFDESINAGTNYIDAQVRKVNNKYYMVIKSESRVTNNANKSPLLFSSDSPDKNFEKVSDWPLRGIRGYEGFSILTRNNMVYIYADNFSQKYDHVGTSGHTVWVAAENNVEKGPYKAYYVNSKTPLRHGSVINNLDDSAIENLNIADFFKGERSKPQNTKTVTSLVEVPLTKEDFGRNDKIKNTVIIDNFAPAPNVVYAVPSKTKVVIDTVVNPYGVKEIQFKFNKDSKLKIGQEYIKDKVVPIDKAISLTKANENVSNSNDDVNEANE